MSDTAEHPDITALTVQLEAAKQSVSYWRTAYEKLRENYHRDVAHYSNQRNEAWGAMHERSAQVEELKKELERVGMWLDRERANAKAAEREIKRLESTGASSSDEETRLREKIIRIVEEEVPGDAGRITDRILAVVLSQ